MVARWRLTPVYVALCGALVQISSDSDTAGCVNGSECVCEVVHCPACLRAAVECNRDAGVDEVGSGLEIRG